MPTLPKTAVKVIAHALGRCDTKLLKEQLFSFLQRIDDVDVLVKEFWSKNEQRIWPWYLAQKKDDDIIISASPEFLLEPICNKLGIELIGTVMDKHSGEIRGENCHDKEKVRRFYERYPGAHTENFYSDSLSDDPMAQIADRAFLVKKDELSPWPKKDT